MRMFSNIVENLEYFDDSKTQLLRNAGIRDDEDVITYPFENELDFNNPSLNLDYPIARTNDNNLNSENDFAFSRVITDSFQDINYKDTPFYENGDKIVTISPVLTVGINPFGKNDSRDPLISSVAGSISSSSYSLDVSSDQLSPSSLLSSVDHNRQNDDSLKSCNNNGKDEQASFYQCASDLDKEITLKSEQQSTLTSISSSTSLLISEYPPQLTNDTSPVTNYVKQPRQGRCSSFKKLSALPSDTNVETISSTTSLVPSSAGPSSSSTSSEQNKRVSDSRLSAQGLAQVLNLNSPEEALKRERYILDIFENDLHYPLGYKTWVRDTSKEYRVKLIQELHDRVKERYPEYDHSVLETIIRRATYYMMQSRLRRERRAKAKGVKLSTSNISS